jgi:hypothetical protein
MQDYSKLQRQPQVPARIPPFRPNYMAQPRPMHEQTGYYEVPPNAAPRAAYPRQMSEYMPNYNPGYQNVPYQMPATQQPGSYQLHPGAAPYIPARYVPPPPGRLRADPNPGANLGNNPANLTMKKATSVPPFYLGNNKKAVSADGIAEEERKAYGMEKFIGLINKRKKEQANIAEQGIDLTTVGLKLNSAE